MNFDRENCIKAMVVFRFLINIFYHFSFIYKYSFLKLSLLLSSSSFHRFVKIFDVKKKKRPSPNTRKKENDNI
jgi:hypothetical protein